MPLIIREAQKIEAFIDSEPKSAPEPVRETDPDPRTLPLSESRQPAFYKVHYFTRSTIRVGVVWRIADSDKKACDLVMYSFNPPVKIFKVTRFDTKEQLLDALPPGRGIRCVFPKSDLKLGVELGLFEKRDTV